MSTPHNVYSSFKNDLLYLLLFFFCFHLPTTGQYAPFGYFVEGIDIMKNLQAGDEISATYVNEWGKLNLKRIRGTSFANAINSNEDDDE